MGYKAAMNDICAVPKDLPIRRPHLLPVVLGLAMLAVVRFLGCGQSG
ncbi:MAG: hypothetical protein ACOH2H_02770 [Cypionkella sp.]